VEKVSELDRDLRLWWLLLQTIRATRKARKRELKPIGISAPEAGVLFVLHMIGNATTPTEISRWLFRESHSVSTLINRMVKEGLVTKANDLERRNLVRVRMTEKGKQAHDRAAKRTSIHRILSSLSEQEYQQLESCLTKLRARALKETKTDRKPPWP